MNYEERATWNKEGSWSVSDKARAYVENIASQDICPLGEERTKALNEAFVEVCPGSRSDKGNGGRSDEKV